MHAHGIVRRARRTFPQHRDDLVERDGTPCFARQQLEDRKLDRRQVQFARSLRDAGAFDVECAPAARFFDSRALPG